MTKINDGGSAFPCEQHENADGSWNQTFDPGMSLRDWFAGQAMAAFATKYGAELLFDEAAQDSYACADALIAARSAVTGVMSDA